MTPSTPTTTGTQNALADRGWWGLKNVIALCKATMPRTCRERV